MGQKYSHSIPPCYDHNNKIITQEQEPLDLNVTVNLANLDAEFKCPFCIDSVNVYTVSEHMKMHKNLTQKELNPCIKYDNNDAAFNKALHESTREFDIMGTMNEEEAILLAIAESNEINNTCEFDKPTYINTCGSDNLNTTDRPTYVNTCGSNNLDATDGPTYVGTCGSNNVVREEKNTYLKPTHFEGTPVRIVTTNFPRPQKVTARVETDDIDCDVIGCD